MTEDETEPSEEEMADIKNRYNKPKSSTSNVLEKSMMRRQNSSFAAVETRTTKYQIPVRVLRDQQSQGGGGLAALKSYSDLKCGLGLSFVAN